MKMAPFFPTFFASPSTPVLAFVQRLTPLNNRKLLIRVRKRELCLLIMKQVTIVWLQNGLRCTL